MVPIFIGVRANKGSPKSGQGKLADLDALGEDSYVRHALDDLEVVSTVIRVFNNLTKQSFEFPNYGQVIE